MSENLQAVVATRKAGLMQALLLSLLSWAGLLLELWLVLGFAGIHPDLPGFFLILVSMRLALLLPLPGGIGTLEASLLWSLQSLNVPASAAVGVIALMRLRDAIVLAAGLLCLHFIHVRQKAVGQTNTAILLADGVTLG